MIIHAISDLHGQNPELPGGDLLILCGDYTAADKAFQWDKFFDWVYKQPYEKKIMIGGNHDNFLQDFREIKDLRRVIGYDKDDAEFEYLCDSGTEYGGLKIWGSPWTRSFAGVNPHCKAFMLDTEEELNAKFSLIPNNTDILITHGPPYLIMDMVDTRYCGSYALRRNLERVMPKVHIFGHIHEGYGKTLFKGQGPNTWCYNVSHVDKHYDPINPVTEINHAAFRRTGKANGPV